MPAKVGLYSFTVLYCVLLVPSHAHSFQGTWNRYPSKIYQQPSDLASASYLIQGFPNAWLRGFSYSNRWQKEYEEYLLAVLSSRDKPGNVELAKSLQFLSQRIYLDRLSRPVLVIDDSERKRHLQTLRREGIHRSGQTTKEKDLRKVIIYYLELAGRRVLQDTNPVLPISQKRDGVAIGQNVRSISNRLIIANAYNKSLKRPYPVR